MSQLDDIMLLIARARAFGTREIVIELSRAVIYGAALIFTIAIAIDRKSYNIPALYSRALLAQCNNARRVYETRIYASSSAQVSCCTIYTPSSRGEEV